ncbi:MAG: nucleotidyltransferase [Oscillospiraceae bacterium]|nr:nucleotidyltransferase [Oscillospiraceae bacterium]
MKIVGIIAEYNPFHNGHKFHIEEAKRLTGADAAVVVMSGNYVQRGDVAVFDKQTRARAAIAFGADLVIELPTVCAAQSAEIFARSSVCLMDALNCVDYLAFGAEASDIGDITEVAKFLSVENDEFDGAIRAKLKTGISYASARAEAVAELCGAKQAEILQEPNNILAVEYLKALYTLKSDIQPVLIKRRAVGHDDSNVCENFASASLIRKKIKTEGLQSVEALVPTECIELYKTAEFHTIEAVQVAILANLRRMTPNDIAKIADVSEGLENRISAFAKEYKTLDELIDAVKTKRYTHARMRRIMLHSYLGITREDIMLPQYLKILDFSPKGQEILNNLKRTKPALALAKNFRQIESADAVRMWQDELKFDSLYELCVR